ncbi:hypothetical protein ACPOL_3405 [Acidisarcina polymorpha]|uniref:Uncharacterized protein n=1 Tax=Acidisarcina polymorpha TaxID=2211140 RepID=A0A2Z5G0R0_9BACT|nr:hypothetical protein ACPOL_3405 [Acidisarcina polymorpha]
MILSTMIGTTEIAQTLPDPAVQERILSSTCEFLLSSF